MGYMQAVRDSLFLSRDQRTSMAQVAWRRFEGQLWLARASSLHWLTAVSSASVCSACFLS